MNSVGDQLIFHHKRLHMGSPQYATCQGTHVLQMYGSTCSCGHWKQSMWLNLPSHKGSMQWSLKMKGLGRKSQLGEVIIWLLWIASTHASKASKVSSRQIFFHQNMRQRGTTHCCQPWCTQWTLLWFLLAFWLWIKKLVLKCGGISTNICQR